MFPSGFSFSLLMEFLLLYAGGINLLPLPELQYLLQLIHNFNPTFKLSGGRSSLLYFVTYPIWIE